MNPRAAATLAALLVLALAPLAGAQDVQLRVDTGLLAPLKVSQDLPVPLPIEAPAMDVDAPATVDAAFGETSPSDEPAPDAPAHDDEPAPPSEPSRAEPSFFAPIRAHALLVPLALPGPVGVLDLEGLETGIPLGPLLTEGAAEAPAPAPEPPAAPVVLASVAAAPAPVAATAATASLVAVAAASAAGPALGLWWERAKRLLVFAGLYARIAKENLLDHGSRERLLDEIRATPGLPVQDLATRTGVPRNTATYHLRRMEREGLVTSSRSGRVRVWFVPGGAARRDEAPAFAALRHATTRAIAREIAATPGLDQRALCERFSLAPSLAHWHADRLVEAGLLRKERDGRRVRYYPTEGLPRFASAMA